MKGFLTGTIFSAALLMTASANASIVSVTEGGVAGDGGFVSSFAPTTYNFNAVGGTFASWTGDIPILATGPVSGAAAPFGDTTQYTSVGTVPTPGTSQLVLSGGSINYIGLYWGSIDSYNSITITDADGTTVINSANYGILNPANGNQGLGGSAYVNIFDSKTITSVVFSSSTQAFEFDNLTVAAVPEAATWAMMILGFLGLGFLGYRRSSRSALGFRLA
jgi:hypothetical protein